MIFFLVLAAFGEVAPGPLDGFRANFASIRADVDYEYEFGFADSRTAENGGLWKGAVIGFDEQPNRAVVGRWSYDGTTERYEGQTPDSALQKARKQHGNGETRPFFTEPFELIFDGERTAYHTLTGQSTNRRAPMLVYYPRKRAPGGISSSGAPFCWYSERFPITIEDEFRDARRERISSMVNGFRTELEIYSQNTNDVRRLEVHYDPAIGYIPRYARVTGPINATSQAFKELYVLDARPCALGGFIPLEWYALSYYVDDFDRRYPSYNWQTVVKPTFHLLGIGHYRAVRLTDRKKPVALEKLAGITTITTTEGRVPLGVVTDRMGLGEVDARIHRGLVHPKPRMPTVDMNELRRFSGSVASDRRWYAVLGVCLTVPFFAGGFYVLRRRRSLFLLIGLFTICSGCGQSQKADKPLLTAKVTPTFLVYEPSAGLLNVSITVKNDGDDKIKVFQASAGCSCRKLDLSPLPKELSPGSEVTLSARIFGESSYDPKRFPLVVTTDRGLLEFPLRHVALPRHNLSGPFHK